MIIYLQLIKLYWVQLTRKKMRLVPCFCTLKVQGYKVKGTSCTLAKFMILLTLLIRVQIRMVLRWQKVAYGYKGTKPIYKI